MEKLIVTLYVHELKALIEESVQKVLATMSQPKHEEEILLRRKDVAKFFSVSLVTVSQWMKNGKLPYHRINTRIFFKRSELLESLQSTKKYTHLRK